MKPVSRSGSWSKITPRSGALGQKWWDFLCNKNIGWIVFLFQPLFLNFANHIFRVLSPHRPYQELNIISSLTINVHRKLSLSSRQNPDSKNSKRLASPWWSLHTLAPLPPPLDGHQSHHPGFPLSKGVSGAPPWALATLPSVISAKIAVAQALRVYSPNISTVCEKK